MQARHICGAAGAGRRAACSVCWLIGVELGHEHGVGGTGAGAVLFLYHKLVRHSLLTAQESAAVARFLFTCISGPPLRETIRAMSMIQSTENEPGMKRNEGNENKTTGRKNEMDESMARTHFSLYFHTGQAFLGFYDGNDSPLLSSMSRAEGGHEAYD